MPIMNIGDIICSLIDLQFTTEEIANMSVDEMYITVYDILSNNIAA